MDPTTTTTKRQLKGTQYANKRKDTYSNDNVYNRSLLSRKVHLHISSVGRNIKQNLESYLEHNLEGKCIAEGYIRPGTIRILKYSNGVVSNEFITFDVSFEFMICYPVEGHNISCISKTITKAGIHCIVKDEDNNEPINIFIARDHHMDVDTYNKVREGDVMRVQIVGVRFELNDPYICVIGELLNTNVKYKRGSGNTTEDGEEQLLLPTFTT